MARFFKYNKLEKRHLNTIYTNLSQKFYENAMNSDYLMHSIQLIGSILHEQNPSEDHCQSYFYFSGLNSGLSITKDKQVNWMFSNGFGLSIWFYLEEANGDISQETEIKELTGVSCPKLFTIHCQGHGGIEAYFVGNNLYYRNLAINYTQPSQGSNGVLVGEFKPKIWYYLGLEHEKKGVLGRSHLNIVIDKQPKKSVNVEFPKIGDVPITTFVFGENFIGRVSTIIVYQTPVNQNK